MTPRMRSAGLLAALLLVASCAAAPSPADGYSSVGGATAAVDVSFFYDELAPYGRWIDEPGYGWCWAPDVSFGWRPYTDGYWVYTDFGWTWVSYEPWGWATCHYGGWFEDPEEGWLWVPGTVWAQARVAWRYADDWVGWAPLPPGAYGGFSLTFTSVDVERIPAERWCFVERSRLFDTGLRGRVQPVARNVTLFARTRDATHYESRDGRWVNRGVDVGLIERSNGRPVPRMRVADLPSPVRGRSQEIRGGAIALFRPQLRPAPPGSMPHLRPAERAPRSVSMPVPIRPSRDEDRRRSLESYLGRERRNLERAQSDELRSRGREAAPEELRQRQADERRAFDQQAQRERQRLERQMQRRGRPAQDSQPERPDRGRGRGGDRRDRGGKDDR